MDTRNKDLEKVGLGIGLMFGMQWIYLVFIVNKLDFGPIIKSLIGNFILYVIGLFIFTQIIKSITNTKIEKSEISSKTLIICFLLQFLAFFIFPAIKGISMFISNIISGNKIITSGQDVVVDLGELNLQILFVLIIFNPIVEEFVFRKLFADKLLKYGELFYMMVSSFCFALPHIISVGPSHFIYTYLLGMIWSYLYIKTGSLKWPIIFHSLSNIFNGIIQMFIANNFSMTVFKAYMIFMLILGIIGGIVFLKNKKEISIDGDNKLFDKDIAKNILGNKGIIFYILTIIVMVVYINLLI